MDQRPGVHCHTARKRRLSRGSSGFSLIEILVVVSLIGFLLAIGVAVALQVTREARRDQTRQMMEGLLAANDEYKAVRQGTSISHTGPTSGLSSTQQFVAACLEIKTCEEIMMAALNSSTSAALERTYTNGTVFDRWGTEIEYRQSNDGSGSGPANTGGESIDNDDLPLSRDPFFASAGPDTEWGTNDDITTLQQ